MSKLANKPLNIPQGVEVKLENKLVVIKGQKGILNVTLLPHLKLEIQTDSIIMTKDNESKTTKAYCGLVYRLIRNAIIGVSEGFKKTLKLVGTGYRVAVKGEGLELSVGYSQKIEVRPIEDIKFKIEGNNIIHIEGFDKQKVGQMAADIRAIKPPEPYQGKGIRYIDEVVKKKPGKAAAGAGAK